MKAQPQCLLSTLPPDWSNNRIEDKINAGWPWSGYVQGQGEVTHATVKSDERAENPNPDWTAFDVDRDSNTASLMWTNGAVLLVESLKVPPVPRADAPKNATGEWCAAKTKELQGAGGKIKGVKTMADLARRLAAESKAAAKAGELEHAFEASYLENWLGPKQWGIWPLGSFK